MLTRYFSGNNQLNGKWWKEGCRRFKLIHMLLYWFPFKLVKFNPWNIMSKVYRIQNLFHSVIIHALMISDLLIIRLFTQTSIISLFRQNSHASSNNYHFLFLSLFLLPKKHLILFLLVSNPIMLFSLYHYKNFSSHSLMICSITSSRYF